MAFISISMVKLTLMRKRKLGVLLLICECQWNFFQCVMESIEILVSVCSSILETHGYILEITARFWAEKGYWDWRKQRDFATIHFVISPSSHLSDCDSLATLKKETRQLTFERWQSNSSHWEISDLVKTEKLKSLLDFVKVCLKFRKLFERS
jgi:hypothetical protein